MTNGEWILEGELLDETSPACGSTISARACTSSSSGSRELVAIGALEPHGGFEPAEWSFPLTELRRARMVARLVDELEVDLHGAAIIADLIEERRRLVGQLQRLLRRSADRCSEQRPDDHVAPPAAPPINTMRSPPANALRPVNRLSAAPTPNSAMAATTAAVVMARLQLEAEKERDQWHDAHRSRRR